MASLPLEQGDRSFCNRDCEGEEIDIYQQLAEKDHYLILAAEAGKVLLEKNQELTNHFELLQEEYMQKIEVLEQDRHHLKRELNERSVNYESRMQDLQHEISNLGGQLQIVRKSRSIDHSMEYENLVGQNNSLMHELENVKSYNHRLTQQIQSLSNRIDERTEPKANHSDYRRNSSGASSNHVDYAAVENLKQKVRKLEEQKDNLEDSLNKLVSEKDCNNSGLLDTDSKVSTLEEDVSNLRQQMIVCQEELKMTKRKNEHLRDQLEEYVLIQSSQPGSHINNSLLNELEMSVPEVDMNFPCMSTPSKYNPKEIPQINIDHHMDQNANLQYDKLSCELRGIYHKLRRVKEELGHESEDDDIELKHINGEAVTELVDQVIELIHNKILAMALIDDRSTSPCQLEIDTSDSLSQPDSQASDRDLEIFEQQIHDLNQRLNMTVIELEKAKRALLAAQTSAKNNEDRAQALTVRTNCQEREIENLRREREILLNDKSMDDKFKKALQERDEALERENETMARYEKAQNDMSKLNDQLMAAVQQKLELSEQLEQWQFDMASLIDQQVHTKIKRDNQKSRKRGNNISKSTRSLAAKFFASKSAKEAPQTATM